MKKILICFILFLSSTSQAFDSDTVSIHSDSINIKAVDTSLIKIISTPYQSWINRNEGAIIGSFIAAFFAGLIAILSIYLTSRSNQKQIEKQEIDIYCGLLNAIKIELSYQLKNYKYLIQELLVILNNSLLANEIIVEKPSRDISLDFLRNIRDKIIEVKIFNTTILLLLSSYINKCELINYDINFDRLIKVSQRFKATVDFPKAAKTYFNIVINEIHKNEKFIPDLVKFIDSDLQSHNKTIDIDGLEYFDNTELDLIKRI